MDLLKRVLVDLMIGEHHLIVDLILNLFCRLISVLIEYLIHRLENKAYIIIYYYNILKILFISYGDFNKI